MNESVSFGTASCGHVGQIFKTGKCAHCYIADLERLVDDRIARISMLTQMEGRLRNYWDQEKRRAEIFREERDIARASFDRAVRTLSSIHALLNPPDVTVEGRTYRFDNPAIQLEAYRALSEAIRAIPEELKGTNG